MTTDIIDEHVSSTSNLSYDPSKDSGRPSSATVLETPTISSATTHRRAKYSTQTSFSSPRPSTTSFQQRNNGGNDLFSILRSLALKPFRTASMSEAVAGGQASNVIGGSSASTRTPVNLLRYRPLSDVISDTNSYTQSSRAVENFCKQMGWSIEPNTDEARVKWNTAMKFLNATKFDVNRAMDLYKIHENIRKNEHLDRIWINNPHLIREIQSNKFLTLPFVSNQPLAIIYSISNLNLSTPVTSLSQQERELIAYQAFICQLDVATESSEVQENGLNFICDLQPCSSSPLEISLTKKIIKLLQNSYPVMLKNLFIIAAPKWLRAVHKVTLHSVDQMRRYFIDQYRYSFETIPISFGGQFDPSLIGSSRFHQCASTVTNVQSICSSFYSVDYQPLTTKSNNHIVFFNSSDHHDASSSLVAIVALKSSSGDTSQIRVQKRESSSTIDQDKRQRSNESLIEEEEEEKAASTNRLIDSQLDRYDINDVNIRQSMLDTRTSDMKRMTIRSTYKPLDEKEFLGKSQADIRQEFRRMANPPAKDTHAARDEQNVDKCRYRDVIPGESTRVKLQADVDDQHDFINANYVSGYKNQEKAYIFTQGPLPTTVRDFWRMIWQEKISVIVMTTNLRESGMVKCHPYWPLEANGTLQVGSYLIQNIEAEKYDSFLITRLTLRKNDHEEIRTVYHAHYVKWPDHGIPTGTKDALLFLEKVDSYRQATETKAPILLHCSAGIGRTGTFCAIDIGIKRYLDTRLIDIPSTVVKMRHERAGSVQTEDQYLFIHLAMMDFIKQEQQNSKSSKSDESLSTPIRRKISSLRP